MNIQTPFFSFHPSKFRIITFSSSLNNPSHCTGSESRITQCKSKAVCAEFPEPISNSASAIKAPTAPWMNERLLVKSNEILEFTKQKSRRNPHSCENGEHPDIDLTGKVGGGRGKVAMKKIFKSIEKLQETPHLEINRKVAEKFIFAPGDMWGDGDFQNGNQIEEVSEEVEEFLGSGEFDIPLVEIEQNMKVNRMPWERNDRIVVRRVKEKKVMDAELRLDEELLERLRDEAATMRKWVKVKKAGVTQAVVDEIRLIWRSNELALLKFDVPLCRNMDRAGEIVEAKTGGLVVWRNKDFLAVYKYLPSAQDILKKNQNSTGYYDNFSSKTNYKNTPTVPVLSPGKSSVDELIHVKDGKRESLHMSSLYEREADRLLDGLGPRFVDWWMQKPLPVDADLLPETVSGLKTPFRLCLPHTRSQLTDAELTHLRKLARPLPTHFVLGRNRKLQGLAASILKLWEKCHMAKIALKWGVPNTDNEQMANELKSLTGGVLLLRNKYLIILYRGKDFVPTDVANIVAKRETELTRFQFEEEAARIKASEAFSTTYENLPNSGIVGTLSEFINIQSERSNLREMKTEVQVQMEVEREKLENELKDQEQRLFMLKKKIEKSAKILEKLNHSTKLSEQGVDKEIISQEERECLREIGLKSDSCLVLGRRGVYDGVIEGVHQHWKHREIVKVITMQKKYLQIIYTAKSLEAESGGILVSIVKLKEGHAIIIYRGKNYKRPNVPSQNLLKKREALFRSLEIQRIGSLSFFAKQREQTIFELKRKLAEFPEKGVILTSQMTVFKF